MVRFGPIFSLFLPGDYPEWVRWLVVVVSVLLATIFSLIIMDELQHALNPCTLEIYGKCIVK